ncbi:hypothetical protein, partial [Salmonella sp. s51228]|uniref:hypothetical protein n=1 Tax=Salmonella sp. s51228 TaxID=3159652 RepID=UPI003980FDA3
ACPDTALTPVGTDGCLNVGMIQENGATTFTFTRKITSTDTRDRNFTLNLPQTIIWAKGGTFLSTMNNERWVLRHQPSDRANQQSPITLDLNATSTCSSTYQCTISTETIEAWEIPPICGSAETTTIVAAIG